MALLPVPVVTITTNWGVDERWRVTRRIPSCSYCNGDLGGIWLLAMGSNRNLPRASDGSVILSSWVLIASLVLPHRHPLLWDSCRLTAVLENLVRPVSFLCLLSFTKSASSRGSITKPFSSHYFFKRAALEGSALVLYPCGGVLFHDPVVDGIAPY